MSKIRFAILGPGNISKRVVKGMKQVEELELYGVAARSLNKAEAFQIEYNIPHAYGSYEACLEDKNVDAVYIATPTQAHFDMVMEALRHGKHVMCEKPFMVHSKQVKVAFQYAKEHQLLLMEAFKANFLPVTKQVKKWMETGLIGKVRYLEGSYCYKFDGEKDHWVYTKKYGGGGLYDVGIYPLGFCNYLANSPVIDFKSTSLLNTSGVDDLTQVLLTYENGLMASIRGGIGISTKNIAYIYGEDGYIEIPDFWKCDKAYLHQGDKVTIFEEKHNKDEFKYEIQAFVNDLLNHKVEDDIMSENASYQNLRIMERSVNLSD
ncbi:MAG: Gfo/Idh/MocA family oxidoreductase [Erysipelotrichaceae bacterium]